MLEQIKAKISELTPKTTAELEAEADRKWEKARKIAAEQDEVIPFRATVIAKSPGAWRQSYREDIKQAEQLIEDMQNE